MINTGRGVVFLSDGNEVQAALRAGIARVKELHEADHGKYTGEPKQNKASAFGYLRAHEVHNFAELELRDPKKIIGSLMESCLRRAVDRSNSSLIANFGVQETSKIPICQNGSLFRGASTILIWLWSKGHIVLNPYFSPNIKGMEQLFDPITISAFQKWVGDSELVKDTDQHDAYHHTKRLFWATDWTDWSNFDIRELASLHAKWLNSKSTLKSLNRSNYPVPPIPFRLFLRFLQDEEFSPLDDKSLDGYGSYLNESKAQIASRGGKASTQATTGIDSVAATPAVQRTESEIFALLATLKRDFEVDGKWPGAKEVRRYWEDLPIRETGMKWAGLFDDYLADWYKRYESDSKYKALLEFNDYLFVYLNWWHATNPTSELNFPERPGDVKRFTHIKPRSIKSEEALPLTFSEYLQRMYESRLKGASATRAAYDLFDWLLEEYGGTPEQAEYFDQGFANPIRENDIHYEGASRPHAAKRIGKRHAILLTDYLLAVENFYRSVEQRVLDGEMVVLPERPIPVFIDSEKYGLTPIVRCGDSFKPIRWIPSMYQQHENCLVKDFKISSWLPNLSALRMLCFMMETGLRGAGIRWLDRQGYKDCNSTRVLCKQIHVNTDKANDGFTMPVSDIAYEILSRQSSIVEHILGDSAPSPVPYQNRDQSRFEAVNTLFYASGSSIKNFSPIGQNAYSSIFRVALAMFAEWLTEQFDEVFEFVTSKSNGHDLDALMSRCRSDFCQQTKSEYTPHSIRSTVISERITVLPIRLVGQLVGQRNPEVTAYYNQVDEEQLSALLNGKSLPTGEVVRFGLEADSLEFTHPSRADSPLQTAWRADRLASEADFGFTAMTFQASGVCDGETGIEALRQAEPGQVAFYDTNICPFGGRCPEDVLKEIGEPNRCGVCRYAVKSIDHLPAIAAKVRHLDARCRESGQRAEIARKRGSREDAQRLADSADMDATEAVGWHLAQVILDKKLAEIRSGEVEAGKYHVDQPEVLRNRLAQVNLPNSNVARLLLRVAETNAYPSMQDDEVRQFASRIKRLMRSSDESVFSWEADPVAELCSYISARMDISGLNIEEVISQLENHEAKLRAVEHELPLLPMVKRS